MFALPSGRFSAKKFRWAGLWQCLRSVDGEAVSRPRSALARLKPEGDATMNPVFRQEEHHQSESSRNRFERKRATDHWPAHSSPACAQFN